jgi:hypothetical protein
MHRGSSSIYWCILDLPQHVSASHCHHQGVIVTSEATQAISVLWMYMDYDSSSVVSCQGMQRREYSGFSSCSWLFCNNAWKILGPTIKILVICNDTSKILGPTLKILVIVYFLWLLHCTCTCTCARTRTHTHTHTHIQAAGWVVHNSQPYHCNLL